MQERPPIVPLDLLYGRVMKHRVRRTHTWSRGTRLQILESALP